MPREACDPSKQAITPGNRCTYTIFIDSSFIYTRLGKWGGGTDITSYLGRALQKLIEKHSYIKYALYTLHSFQRKNSWQFVRTPLGQNSWLIILHSVENSEKILRILVMLEE